LSYLVGAERPVGEIVAALGEQPSVSKHLARAARCGPGPDALPRPPKVVPDQRRGDPTAA
jgi:DNA-binding transcriptional ArsR family regulator